MKKDYSNETIGLTLQNARLAAKVTQAEIAEISGLSKNHISAVERGVCKISLDLLLSYCDALKTSPNAILGIGNIIPELQTALTALNKKEQKKLAEIIHLIKEES